MGKLRYTYTRADFNDKLSFVTVTVNGVPAGIGTEVRDGDKVKYIADVGRVFTYNGAGLVGVSFAFNSTNPPIVSRFKYSHNDTVAEIVLNLGDDVDYEADTIWCLTASAPPGVFPPSDFVRYVFDDENIDDLKSQNVVLTNNGELVVVGTEVRDGDSLVAICPQNRIFYEDGALSSIRFQMRRGAGLVEFEISSDGKQATCEFNFDLDPDIEADYFICKTQVVTPQVTAYNGVYKISDSILNSVNKKRFVTSNVGEGSTETIDYGAYIINVIKLPFKISDDYVTDSDNIILGALNTGVKADVITTDNYVWDLGEIYVSGDNNNSLDYFNSKAILNVPYCDPINIDLEYVLNQTVKITYTINLYKGNAILNVYSTYVNSVFITKAIDLGIQIPYINPISTNPENLNIVFVGDNGVKTPFIDIVSFDVSNVNGSFSIPVEVESVLNEVSGYVEVDKIEISSGASVNEVDKLISILKDGVFL